jgi:hypothetical protein
MKFRLNRGQDQDVRLSPEHLSMAVAGSTMSSLFQLPWGQSSTGRKTSASLLVAVVAAAAVGCAVAVAWVLLGLRLLTIENYNEGWNAYNQAAAVGSGALYPDAASMMFNNYPPLSFPIVGLLGKLTGDFIIAGRLIALFAFLGIAAGIGTAARIMGAGRLESAYAALFFMAVILIIQNYARINDPQMLGLAFGMAGIVCVLAAPHARGAIVAGAFAFTLAGFVKHNLVVQPLVVLVWLALYDRRRALWFAAAGLVFSAVGLAVADLVYNTDLVAHLISPRLYSGRKAFVLVSKWLIVWLIPLGAILLCLRQRRHDRYVVFCALYAVIAIVVGAVFTGGAGTGTSSLFETVIALALCTGVVLNRWGTQSYRPALFALICLLPLTAGMARNAKGAWLSADYWLHPYAAEQAATVRDIGFLRSQDGPVACEMLALCYWAGKPAEIDFFNLSQATLKGVRTDDALVSRIDAREFGAIQVLSLDNVRNTGAPQRAPGGINPPFSTRVREAMERAYRVDHADENGLFLVPRR